jgi:disulfide bond formation protein DsbB
MTRIAATFERLRQSGRKALIPYFTAGHPSRDHAVPMMHALAKAGADIIELGVPFSDPMADGPVIQKSSEAALALGVGLGDVLQWVSEFRRDDNITPIVLMGYLNPIERMGAEAAGTHLACCDCLAKQFFGFGLAPCELCLWQRWAYAGAIAGLLPAVLLPRSLSRLSLVAGALGFAAGSGIALFHVGVENKWWAGLSGCSAPTATGSVEDFLKALETAPVVRCDEVAWSLLGVSMAGYNMVFMAGLAVLALLFALLNAGRRAAARAERAVE